MGKTRRMRMKTLCSERCDPVAPEDAEAVRNELGDKDEEQSGDDFGPPPPTEEYQRMYPGQKIWWLSVPVLDGGGLGPRILDADQE
jgi:hypothetical protein